MDTHEAKQMLIEGYMIRRWLEDFDEDNPNTLTLGEISEQGYYREEAERKYWNWRND
jgi:hypothetical protein